VGAIDSSGAGYKFKVLGVRVTVPDGFELWHDSWEDCWGSFHHGSVERSGAYVEYRMTESIWSGERAYTRC